MLRPSGRSNICWKMSVSKGIGKGILAGVLGLVFMSLGWAAETEEASRPNIVVIMADDLGWKDLHCYGNELLDTPALDKLASEGMRFTDAYAAAPVCSPTRAAMMTGQAPARLRLTNHAPGHPDGFAPEGSSLAEAQSVRNLALSYETVAEQLSDAGYETAHIGKWHLSYAGRGEEGKLAELELRPEHQGFGINIGGCYQGGPPSYFAPYRIPALTEKEEGEYLPERLADEAIAFVEEERNKPFYLNWWPYSVHYPMEGKEELIAKYRARKGPGIKNPIYAAMIEAMDTEIGRFLVALDEAGLRENTLVIFKSDNGGYDGDNRPLRGMKGMLYEGGIRIPWFARWPGKIRPGSTCSTPVVSMDCYPTLLEVAGVEPVKTPVDGESLLPLFQQSEGFERDAIFFHYPNFAFHKLNQLGGVVRVGDHKLIKRYDDGELELFNLKKDLGETDNLAEESPELAQQLEEKLDAWLQEVGAAMPIRVGKEKDAE
ncbi:sulfatase [Roseibacillus persicicus]|nr:sulfatase [Roseibacillus persicicus]